MFRHRIDLGRAVSRHDGVGVVAPIVPSAAYFAWAGERAVSDGPTPPFKDTHPGQDHELAMQKFFARLRPGVSLHKIPRGWMSVWLIGRIRANSACR